MSVGGEVGWECVRRSSVGTNTIMWAPAPSCCIEGGLQGRGCGGGVVQGDAVLAGIITRQHPLLIGMHQYLH